MNEYLSDSSSSFKCERSRLDAVALYGYSSAARHLANLFSRAGIQVYLFSSNNDEIYSSTNNFFLIKDEDDLPYLSSVLINCQNDLMSVKNFLNRHPKIYKQRMAYVECSSLVKKSQLELFYEEIKFQYYLYINLIELESSTMIQPHLHLICSGDKIVFHNLLFKTNIPAKITFLNQTRTPFDSFYICLLHRCMQAMHVAIYTEMIAVFNTANQIYPGMFLNLLSSYTVEMTVGSVNSTRNSIIDQ